MELVLSEYVKVIKNAWNEKISDQELMNLLFSEVIDRYGLKNKSGEPYYFSKTKVSQIVNRQDNLGNLPSSIVEAFSRENFRNVCIPYFRTDVLPFITMEKRKILADALFVLIDNDNEIVESERGVLKDFCEKAQNNLDCFAAFLVEVFVYVGQRNNSYGMTESQRKKAMECPIPIPHVPEELDSRELPYISAIIEAISDKEHDEYTYERAMSNKEYAGRVKRYREDFFKAEALRRNCRDVFPKNKTPFDAFEIEIYEGVIDEWEREHRDGLDCLASVLRTAGVIQTGRTDLERNTKWVGPAEKKGTCHILVNEEKIKGWVK